MQPRTSLTRVALSLMILATTFAGARAQRLDDGRIDFEQKSRKFKDLRRELFTGATKADAKNKDHMEAIDLAAKAVAYPLFWESQNARPKDGEMNKILDFFESDLNQLSKFRANT